jgi:hypothetical protein
MHGSTVPGLPPGRREVLRFDLASDKIWR